MQTKRFLPRNNQNPTNLFFPSNVAFSGEAGKVSAVIFCGSIMLSPLYHRHRSNLLCEYGTHDRL